ncbi:unnamed protein product [Euphydryas editha]|uniref:RRM domain-containing protein n=1 Tax=Euphydryas editha TaxID=104508 RepID=A0AAU9VCD0_EUPED|nr:unnamed protein product [Euphydryas editha]
MRPNVYSNFAVKFFIPASSGESRASCIRVASCSFPAHCISVWSDSGCAFLTYFNPESASNAQSALHEKRTLPGPLPVISNAYETKNLCVRLRVGSEEKSQKNKDNDHQSLKFAGGQ